MDILTMTKIKIILEGILIEIIVNIGKIWWCHTNGWYSHNKLPQPILQGGATFFFYVGRPYSIKMSQKHKSFSSLQISEVKYQHMI